MLKYLNKRIYLGDDLDMERRNVEAKIENTRDKIWFTSDSNDQDIEWILNEGKMVKSFLHLDDIQGSPKIKELSDGNHTASSSQEILPVIHDFYQRLYAQNDLKTMDQLDNLLNTLELPLVSQDTTELVQPIAAKEIAKAIEKLKVGKAPGIDGITADFYKHFSDQLCEILAAVFNQIFEDKMLLYSQKIAIIILLFKKGDSQLVENYCPISLTNTGYKILAYVLTLRLEPFLSQLIHANQTAYMSKRFIGTNIRSVQDYVEYCQEQKTGGVLFLDFRKAFDSNSHQCLFAVLKKMGLPQHYIQWIEIMHQDITSCVRHNNWLTPHFVLERGVQQGCPLSCHLFNFVGQVLIYALHQKGFFVWWPFWGDPCSLYADDTAIFIMNLSQLPSILWHIHYIGLFTGLQVNLSKTIVLYPTLNNEWNENWNKNKNKVLISGVEVGNLPVKYLGAYLGCNDTTTMNFEHALSKARLIANRWKKCTFTLPAQVTVIKTFIFSVFVHVLNVVEVSSSQIDTI